MVLRRERWISLGFPLKITSALTQRQLQILARGSGSSGYFLDRLGLSGEGFIWA